MMETDEKERDDGGIAPTNTTNLEKEVDISDLSDLEKPSDNSIQAPDPAEETTEPEFQYVTGIKLWLATAAVTLVCFLMMLDMSIIATVSLDHFILASPSVH
jgi:hypothetical protein